MVNPNKKATALSVCVVVLSLLIGYFGYCLWPSEKGTPAYFVDKTLRFSYTLKNTSGDLIPQVEFISYLPLDISGRQILINTIASHDYEIIEEKDNHQSIKFTLSDLPPYGSRVINLTLELKTSLLSQPESIKKSVYLKNEKYIEVDSEAVLSVIRDIKLDQNPEKSIYQWLANNIKDVGYIAENKGARFALEQRMGDCTEHMYAFVALARAKGIPARGIAGFVVQNPAEILTSSSYHNWAEFYDGKKWILVDSQRRVFDDQYPHYIPFRIFGSEPVDTARSTNRFLSTDSRISINL